jgi:hypothetical protein
MRNLGPFFIEHKEEDIFDILADFNSATARCEAQVWMAGQRCRSLVDGHWYGSNWQESKITAVAYYYY